MACCTEPQAATRRRRRRHNIHQGVNVLSCNPCCAGAVVALWLLIPPSHDLTTALQLSSGFLQAQRATQPEALPSFSGLLPADSVLNLKDTVLTQTALKDCPWLRDGPTGSGQDLIQVGSHGRARNNLMNKVLL